MEVSRMNGNVYHAPPPPPLAPMPGSGEFAPAPVEAAPLPPSVSPPPPVTTEINGGERFSTGEPDTLRRAVNEINSSIAIYRRHLGVTHHEATNRRIVTVYDSDTNEIIRQIPPESVLEAHASMLEMVGIFMDTRG